MSPDSHNHGFASLKTLISTAIIVCSFCGLSTPRLHWKHPILTVPVKQWTKAELVATDTIGSRILLPRVQHVRMNLRSTHSRLLWIRGSLHHQTTFVLSIKFLRPGNKVVKGVAIRTNAGTHYSPVLRARVRSPKRKRALPIRAKRRVFIKHGKRGPYLISHILIDHEAPIERIEELSYHSQYCQYTPFRAKVDSYSKSGSKRYRLRLRRVIIPRAAGKLTLPRLRLEISMRKKNGAPFGKRISIPEKNLRVKRKSRRQRFFASI